MFEGAEMSVLLRALRSTLCEKLEWLEESQKLVLQFRANREKAKKRKPSRRA